MVGKKDFKLIAALTATVNKKYKEQGYHKRGSDYLFLESLL